VCLLIHGFGDGGYVWADLCSALPSGYRALAVDLRGHGLSTWSVDGRYDIERHIADVLQVLDRIESRRVILIGHSLGGEIALRITARRRDRIEALALIDFGPDHGSGVIRVHSDLDQSFRLYSDPDDYVRWVANLRPLASLPTLQFWSSCALSPASEGGYRLRIDPALIAPDNLPIVQRDLLWSLLRRLTVPTLVVRGAGSAVLPRRVAEQMAMELPNGVLRVVGRAGHAVMLDNPEAFKRVVGLFLEDVRARADAGESRPVDG
jgi:pimeloyl-ACP methyl ester carboxylesterase